MEPSAYSYAASPPEGGEPDYSGAPAQGYYGPPPEQEQQAPPPAPPKKKPAAIIIAVVVVLLLCCCGVGAAGLFFFAADSEVTTDGSIEVPWDSSDDGSAPLEAEADPAWTAFAPAGYDPAVIVGPSARNVALVEEIHPQLYPDFAIEEVLSQPGFIDGETYWDDALFVRAAHRDDSSVRIAYVLYIELEEAWAADISYDPESLEEYLTLATTANDTEYLYDHEQLVAFLDGVSDSQLIELLAEIDTQFPGYVADYVERFDDTAYVTITRWEAFPEYSGGFDLTYTLTADGWMYDSAEQW